MNKLWLLLALSLPALARDPAQVYAFRTANPCPATGNAHGACPGYVVDHIAPLCAGGSDNPGNMQWMKLAESKKNGAQEIAACAFLRVHNLTCK